MNQFQILVADIGGTNARFGLVELGKNPGESNYQDGFFANQQITLKCEEHASIQAMVRTYCQKIGIGIPKYACLAIAGPIEDGYVKMTNLNWLLSIEEMRTDLDMSVLEVINDFSALAYSTPFLQGNDIATLYPQTAKEDSAKVIFGPGTGFGMAALVPCGDDWIILPTEGGHCSFAPTNDKELGIRAYVARTQDHISIEDLLSGRGLVTIYRALADMTGVTAQPYDPADVSNKGIANEDPLCREAIETFCQMLGGVAGDKALTTGAKGGVYLGGGIIPKIASYLPQSRFLAHYKHKGPMVNYVGEIPVYMILNDKAALIGTAAWVVNKSPELRAIFRRK